MVVVLAQSAIWRDVTEACLACGPRADDIPDAEAEFHEAALLRQYLLSSIVLGTTVAVCIAGIAARPPSSLSAAIAVVASLALGYLLFLTGLSAVPEELRSILALRSQKVRRMRLSTAAICVVETLLPGCLVLAVLVTAW